MHASMSESAITQPQAGTAAINGGVPVCIAIIWLKGSGSTAERNDVLNRVRAYQGVLAARMSPGRPDVIMVNYQQGSVHSSEIIALIRGEGCNAMQVGC